MYILILDRKNHRFSFGKFRQWIGVDEITSFRFIQDVVDVIGHLAHETVRKVTCS